MSKTTLLNVTPNAGVEWTDHEYSNSWHSAMLVWDILAKKYLANEVNPLRTFGASYQPLWDLQSDKRLHPYETAVLLMTFDHAYIARTNFARAARDIEAFCEENNCQGHWPAISGVLANPEDFWVAMGFQMTSVASNSFEGGWNDDTDEEIPYDWSPSFEIYS